MIIAITGCMFAGKTTEALRIAEQYKNPLFLKPFIDTRYDKEQVVTHDGRKKKAVVVRNKSDIDKYLKYDYAPDHVVLDELHLFDQEVAEYIAAAFKSMNIPMTITGINKWSNGETPKVLDDMLKNLIDLEIIMYGTCADCGKPATHTGRLVEGGLIEVGGNDIYLPLCESCWSKRNG